MRLSGEGNNIQGKGTSDQGHCWKREIIPFQNVLNVARLAERGEGLPVAKLGFPVVRRQRGEMVLLLPSGALHGLRC